MPRGLRLLSIFVGLLAAFAITPVAGADIQSIVRIADQTQRTNATASTTDQFVRMRPPATSSLQRWSISSTSPTVAVQVVNVGTRGCLQPSPVSWPENAPVLQVPCDGDRSEFWRVVTNSNRTVTFVNLQSSLCLTIELYSPSFAPLLRQNRCANLANQQFNLIPA